MYYILFYDVVDDYINRRAPFRDDHLRIATDAVEKGQLILGGAFDNPVDGAVLVFKADDRAAVEAVKTAISSPDEDDLPPGPARSIYALNARYAILPALPVIGFAFDLSLGYFDLMYPFKKLVSGNATLVAVYRDK